MLKIIAGKYKGRVIKTIKTADYRPSTSSFREALFSILTSSSLAKETDLIQTDVLDLFAGTGALGFEALSRGAKSLTMIDSNEKHVSLLKDFAKSIGTEIDAICDKLPQGLRRLKKKFGLVFLDPPYKSGLLLPTLKELVETKSLLDNAIIVTESFSRDQINFSELPFEALVNKKYNNSKLEIFEYVQK